MQLNRKTNEGTEHPDRDAQFLYIANKNEQFQDPGLLVISVDTKKKELIGRFKNGGREWQRKGEPEKVNAHDFADKELGKSVPYGVYDLTGESNGSRVRLWKIEIQKLPRELNKIIHVCHFPPGTSNWNKIEHRMFCHITENWRSRPLESRAVVVNLIANTRTEKGLKIKSVIDDAFYLKASKSRMRIWQSWRSFATSSMVNGISESTRTTINSVQLIF